MSALPGFCLSNSVLADFSTSAELQGGNNVHIWQLYQGNDGTSRQDPGGDISVTVTTTGFVPFLSLSHFTRKTGGGYFYEGEEFSWDVVGIADNAIASDTGYTLSTNFTLLGDERLDQNSLVLSQYPNTQEVGDDWVPDTQQFTLTGPEIAAGEEEYTLTVEGPVSSFLFFSQYTGDSYVYISDEDKKHAELVISNINNTIITTVVQNVYSTYTGNIKALYRRHGGFSLANNQGYASQQGLNAGDSTSGMAFWFVPNYTKIKNTSINSHDSRYEGDVESYLFGADMVLNSNFMVGAIIGYETSNTDSNDNTKTDTDGYVLSAYSAYNFGSGFTAHGHIGYNNADTDIKDRTIFNTAPGYFKGDYSTDTYFFGFGVMRSSELDNGMIFTMDAGYEYGYTSSEDYNATFSRDSGVTTKVKVDGARISEATLNTELANPIQWGEYYGVVGVLVNIADNDYDDIIDESDFGMNAGVGIRFNATENLLGEISYNNVLLRKGHNDYSFSANLRYDF